MRFVHARFKEIDYSLYFIIDFTDDEGDIFYLPMEKKIAVLDPLVQYVNSYACCQVLMCTCSPLESSPALSDRMRRKKGI